MPVRYYRWFVKLLALFTNQLSKMQPSIGPGNVRLHLTHFRIAWCLLLFSPIQTTLNHSFWTPHANNTGIDGVFSQKDSNGEERVISYGSRILNKPEHYYHVTWRELVAIVYFTQHIQLYLLGKPLPWGLPNGQLAWCWSIYKFNMEIIHCRGHKHTNDSS